MGIRCVEDCGARGACVYKDHAGLNVSRSLYAYIDDVWRSLTYTSIPNILEGRQDVPGSRHGPW